MKSKPKILFFLFALSIQVSFASKLILVEQRKEFLLAEKLIKQRKDTLFFKKLDTLKDYPLYPYLQYQWLINHMEQTGKIKTFLADYPETRYYAFLKHKWLVYLAKHKHWQEFLVQYKDSDNTRLQCYYHQALLHTGAKREALLGAKKLWKLGKSMPGECDLIFKVLKTSPYFTRELLWQRFDVALINSKTQLAKYVSHSMNKKDQGIAEVWLKVHANPMLIVKKGFLDKKHKQTGLIFTHGIDRLARTHIAKAIAIWDARKNDYKIDKEKLQRLEQRLAIASAYHRDSKAYSRLSQLENSDNNAKEWRIRAALREQNWDYVEQSIADLSEEIQKKEKWRYWLARALEKQGKQKIAHFIYDKLSKNRSYYGYLSADKLNKDYSLADHSVQASEEVLNEFKQKTDFRVVAELIAVDKLKEAKRQWWYAVKKLEKNEILIASKYAQQLQWVQEAIFTIAKAKYWDDVSLRFPLAYQRQIQKNAEKQKLNSAIIYGLIRRESTFNQNAMSPAGARGLMQIMPRTGRQIAKELKEKWRDNNNSLFNPSTNIKFGSYYYKKLLNKSNGHYVLAVAGYNAGLSRVKRWLPVEKPVAADIWIEIIPFKETREYVAAVLTYTLIYQKRLKKDILSMKDFMRDVYPS